MNVNASVIIFDLSFESLSVEHNAQLRLLVQSI